MAEKIFFRSAKGGAGATTVAIGLGFALSAAGERTLIVDGDSVCGCALTVSGCAGLQVFTIADYLSGGCRAKQATVQHPKYKNLYIMPTLGCPDQTAAAEAVSEVDGLFDYILCDSTALKECNKSVVITEPYTPSVKAADAAVCSLKDGGARVAGIIVNKVNGGLVFSGDIPYPDDIAAAINAPLISIIPEDMSLTLGQWRPYSMKYFRLTAARLKGKSVRLPDISAGYGGAGGYFRRRMREKI